MRHISYTVLWPKAKMIIGYSRGLYFQSIRLLRERIYKTVTVAELNAAENRPCLGGGEKSVHYMIWGIRYRDKNASLLRPLTWSLRLDCIKKTIEGAGGNFR